MFWKQQMIFLVCPASPCRLRHCACCLPYDRSPHLGSWLAWIVSYSHVMWRIDLLHCCHSRSPDLESFHLKERLVENEDFVLLPSEAWHKLLSWYSMVDSQPALERKVRPLNWQARQCLPLAFNFNYNFVCVFQVVDLPSTLKVEVYPVEIFLCLHSNMENVVTAQFSRAEKICEFACRSLSTLSWNSKDFLFNPG